MSYRFLGIDTSTKRVVQFIDPSVTPLEYALRKYWEYCPHYVERWEWLASTDASAKKRLFYSRYCGRTGSVWKSEYAELNPDNWNMPVYETGVNTLQPSPWRNAIHLRNSKDGTTLDELYISPKIWMRVPAALVFDAYFPAFNTTNYPNGAGLGMGFEVNSGGQRCGLFMLGVTSDGTTVTVQLVTASMIEGVFGGLGLDVSFPTAQWVGFRLNLTQTYLELLYTTTGGAPLTNAGRLYHRSDRVFCVTPFIENEGSAIVSGVKVGQFMAFEEPVGFKSVRKLIDVSSISAGGSAEADGLILTKECALTCRVTYGSTATKGVRVYILAKHDHYPAADTDSENTTDAFAYFEPSFSAGATRQRTVNIDNLPKHCKVVVRNLDTSVATGAVKVYVHEVYG